MYVAWIHLTSEHNHMLCPDHSASLLQIEQPLYWFRETQPLPRSFKEAKSCVQHCSALRIASLQSQRETLWRASGRTNRKPSERTGRMIYSQQRELQLTGMRVDWRATGSIVETVRFILHASWKYNEQEPTTQQPTYRHPRMEAHNYECLQALAATQIKWEHTHTHTQCILICSICQPVKSRVHILQWQTWTISEYLMEQFCLKIHPITSFKIRFFFFNILLCCVISVVFA